MEIIESRAPEGLTRDELIEFEGADGPSSATRAKAERLLVTPFLNNRASERGIQPRRPVHPQLGPLMRIAFWNIAGGKSLDEIMLIWTDPERFLERIRFDGVRLPSRIYRRMAEELRLLQEVDVLILNECDIGMPRSGDRHVADELARTLEMNVAFGVEFIELEPFLLDHKPIRPALSDSPPDEKQRSRRRTHEETKGAEPWAHHGVQGHAILSRYAIRSVSVFRFRSQGFDWFVDEKRLFSSLEDWGQARRTSPHVLTLRQLRLGGRMALLAELAVPELPEGAVSVVTTHLENRARPCVRREQMRELLDRIRHIGHPVILAGDLNTSGRNGTPGRLHRALVRLALSGEFWDSMVLRVAPLLGELHDLFRGAPSLWRIERDPTYEGWLFSSEEAGLFRDLEHFRFDDGRCFDFRGDRERSIHRVTGALANSNERTLWGFVPTRPKRWALGRLRGQKLDWIVVKPYIQRPRDEHASYRFAPHFGRTLRWVNARMSLSDHHPLLVDLPLTEPGWLR